MRFLISNLASASRLIPTLEVTPNLAQPWERYKPYRRTTIILIKMPDRKETNLEYTLTNSYKADLISYIESHQDDFPELVKLSISNKQPYSWRATWLLWSCMDNNDKRIRKHIKKFIDILPERQDNQQRELLMVLQRMELDAKYEGQLFDSCTKIWGNINKNPSLRFNALKIMVSISKRHPDLSNEIKSLTDNYYIDTLTDNVKKSIFKLMTEKDKKYGL